MRKFYQLMYLLGCFSVTLETSNLFEGGDFPATRDDVNLRRFDSLIIVVFWFNSVLNIEILVEEGNTITWQRTLHGTHKANMMGIPQTGKKIKWNEMVVSRFEGDKIAEEWIVSELAGQLLLRQQETK
jgi:hypothetical protein